MEILGVLLGITISAGLVLTGLCFVNTKAIDALLKKLDRYEARIIALEHRKAFQSSATPEAETQTAAPSPRIRWRTWNEDAVMPEGKGN